MDRTWSVEIEGKKHPIEVDYGVTSNQTGKLVVDEKEVQTWKITQSTDRPTEVTFEVGGKPAVLRRKGFFKPNLDLHFEGNIIEPAPSKE